MQQKFFWGMPPPKSALSCLNEVIGNAKTEWEFKNGNSAKLFIFLLWLVIHNYILLATVFITEVPTLHFAPIFSGVSCR